MRNPVLAALVVLLCVACSQTSRTSLDCAITPGVVNLDATWTVFVRKDTLVTWPDSGDTEMREYDGAGSLTVDQCGNHAVVAKFMGGEAEVGGISLFGDFEDVTYTSFGGLPLVLHAEGYIGPTAGWIQIESDYGWVVYDATYVVLLQSRVFKPANVDDEKERSRAVGIETPQRADYR